MSILKLKRERNVFDSLRKYYKIMLDDVCIEKIQSGKTIEIKVAAGKHIIFIQMNWGRSSIIDFKINENETKEFVCGSYLNVGDAIIIVFTFGLFVSLYKGYLADINSYIKLLDKTWDEGISCENGVTSIIKKKRAVIGLLFALIYINIYALAQIIFHRYELLIFALIMNAFFVLNLYAIIKIIKKEES